MRFFADAGLTLADLKSRLAAADRSFKIDGGEVMRGQETLAEIEINRPGSDMFADDVSQMCGQLQALGPQAYNVMARIQNTQAILAVQMLAGSSMEALGPFWQVLQQLSTGLWHIPNQGLYENGQFIVAV
jgi:hypothetical protein